MAKSSGVASALLFGVYDISGDTGAIGTMALPRLVYEVTGLDKSAIERIIGRKDGTFQLDTFWNNSPGGAQAVLGSAISTADVQISWLHSATIGDVGASMIAKQADYNPTLAANGMLTARTNAQANGYGLEWGELLTSGKQTFASGTVTNTAVDDVSSSSFGAAAYLHVVSIASGTATIAIEDSADNVSFAAVTGLTFTAASVATTQRLQTAAGATLREYVHVKVTGIYTNLVAAVNCVRYTETP